MLNKIILANKMIEHFEWELLTPSQPAINPCMLFDLIGCAGEPTRITPARLHQRQTVRPLVRLGVRCPPA